MFGLKIRRPTPALVVALLALLVASSGTAYAALTLPRNSVGTAQLKKGAVTLTKIASSAQGALKPVAWAEVKADTTLLASSGITGPVVLSSTGLYDLTLSKSVTNCAAIATENPSLGLGAQIVGGIAQATVSNGTLEVHTEYWAGSSYALQNENFSVVVYC